MAVNPVTGVDPEVDRFALYRVSTQQIQNANVGWARFDGGPISGGNPDYQYFKRVTSEKPEVDHRYTVETTWELIPTTPTPPEGHPAGTYEQSHVGTKLSPEDLKIQVENEFQRQLGMAFPATNSPAVLIEAADAITRKQNGSVLTPAQQTVLDSMVGIGDVVARLRTRQSALNDAIDADEDYDITEGWD
jgi:hypothetical protein